MMNRRDFLKALGLATGSAFVPAMNSVPTSSRAEKPLPKPLPKPKRARAGNDVQIQIDGEWYTLNEYSIDVSLPPSGIGIDGWQYFDVDSSKREWEFQGSTCDILRSTPLAPVSILFSLESQAFAGQAQMVDMETVAHMYDPIVTKFRLIGVGPLVTK